MNKIIDLVFIAVLFAVIAGLIFFLNRHDFDTQKAQIQLICEKGICWHRRQGEATIRALPVKTDIWAREGDEVIVADKNSSLLIRFDQIEYSLNQNVLIKLNHFDLEKIKAPKIVYIGRSASGEKSSNNQQQESMPEDVVVEQLPERPSEKTSGQSEEKNLPNLTLNLPKAGKLFSENLRQFEKQTVEGVTYYSHIPQHRAIYLAQKMPQKFMIFLSVEAGQTPHKEWTLYHRFTPKDVYKTVGILHLSGEVLFEDRLGVQGALLLEKTGQYRLRPKNSGEGDARNAIEFELVHKKDMGEVFKTNMGRKSNIIFLD